MLCRCIKASYITPNHMTKLPICPIELNRVKIEPQKLTESKKI